MHLLDSRRHRAFQAPKGSRSLGVSRRCARQARSSALRRWRQRWSVLSSSRQQRCQARSARRRSAACRSARHCASMAMSLKACEQRPSSERAPRNPFSQCLGQKMGPDGGDFRSLQLISAHFVQSTASLNLRAGLIGAETRKVPPAEVVVTPVLRRLHRG